MGGMFNGCCGSSPENDNGNDNKQTKNKDNKKSRKSSTRKRKSKNSDDSFEDLNKIDCEQSNQTPEMNTNINFMEPKTLQLLTSIGEIKQYQENTLQSSQIQKDLKTHADILARLENPTAFS
jgi:hypothetical protein